MPHALTIFAPGQTALPPLAHVRTEHPGSRQLVWICPAAPSTEWLQQACLPLAATPEEQVPLQQAIQQQAWGLLPGWHRLPLLPGWHRLPLLPGRLDLHLAIGDPWQLLREASGHFAHITLSANLLQQADRSQREGLAAGLSALARHGTLLQLDRADTPLPEDWLAQLRARG